MTIIQGDPERLKLSPTPTAYATHCFGDPEIGFKGCGQQFMTEAYYLFQMDNPNATWRCPMCGMEAEFDDANWEKVMGI